MRLPIAYAFVLAFMVSVSCATTTPADIVRQSCTVGDATMKVAYKAALTWDLDELSKIDAKFNTGDHLHALEDFRAHHTVYLTVRKALDTANNIIKAVEDLIPGIESARSGDVAGLLAKIATAMADLIQALQSAGVKI